MTTLTRQRLMFAFVCLVWGSTWIAMKSGATHVPPALFAGLRWTIAGIIQLFYVYWDTGRLRLPWNAMRAILIVAVLVNTLNQLFMLYGLRYVASGIGAVINAGLTPLSLLAFAMFGGHERLTKRVALAMGLGVLGILVLFGPSAFSGTLDGATMLGAFLVMMGTLVYSAGSVLARPITQAHSPTLIAGLISLIGGLTLLPISFLLGMGAVDIVPVPALPRFTGGDDDLHDPGARLGAEQGGQLRLYLADHGGLRGRGPQRRGTDTHRRRRHGADAGWCVVCAAEGVGAA